MQRAPLLFVALGVLTACTRTTVDAPAASIDAPVATVADPGAPPSTSGPSFPGTPRPTSIVAGDSACASDADCVPAACCHATACVAATSAPACGDAICTQECKGATIDCGGGCLCQEGRCAARIVDARQN